MLAGAMLVAFGNAFSKLLWSQYEEYQASLQRVVLPVLRDKEARDAQFVTLCKMSRGAVKYTLHDFLHQPVSGDTCWALSDSRSTLSLFLTPSSSSSTEQPRDAFEKTALFGAGSSIFRLGHLPSPVFFFSYSATWQRNEKALWVDDAFRRP
ncbi:hypothetical protein MRX96_004909 [Rhipicephalus microplus]